MHKAIQSFTETRPDTRHKTRLVCVLFTFENNTGHTDGRTDRPTDGPTDRRTDTTSYRDATVHLKRKKRIKAKEIGVLQSVKIQSGTDKLDNIVVLNKFLHPYHLTNFKLLHAILSIFTKALIGIFDS